MGMAYRHKDPTNHGFWHPMYNGPWDHVVFWAPRYGNGTTLGFGQLSLFRPCEEE